jgi:methyl-accepting chemotaxis protein
VGRLQPSETTGISFHLALQKSVKMAIRHRRADQAGGWEIIRSVAWGLALASSAGIVLAAVMGWVISRRISVPVLKLAETTTRMAGGELSTQADLDRLDEIGVLARSFNLMAERIEKTIGISSRPIQLAPG